jgi:hypothetical protein
LLLMSELLHSESSAEAADATRDARIEQLLLSGLDQYFAGQFEQAINIWTRVVFLERGHGRARAYIERARSALAERQRESEEMLHGGLAAYDAGELDRARDLLTRAVEHGGPNETAMVFLDRLSRAGPPLGASASAPQRWLVRSADGGSGADARKAPAWVATLISSAAVIALVFFGVLASVSWFMADQPGPSDSLAPQELAESPEVVPVSTLTLARARALVADGMLREALRLVSAIDLGDAQRPEADRLRAEIQRMLLSDDAPPGLAGEVRP